MRKLTPCSHNRILSLIGILKLLKAAALLVICVAAGRLAESGSVADTLVRWANNTRIDPHNHLFNSVLNRLLSINERQLQALSLGTFVYAALFGTEGVGLIMHKRWAEWLSVTATALLIPLEIWAIWRHATPERIAMLVLNVLIVAYLVYHIRSCREMEDTAQETAPTPATAEPG